ncbi:hypothetical protein DYB34_006515 [Aphanomyces astaci]|uniref:non-specific serine/threonine protein kinase n=1 Tax=Aphanomyces astaci TaxID=112090 RepID=A0A3R6ZAC0_APHAT|nr:hypothetical protein DYB34_006515 [Aphanomyces astaci]
MLQLEEWSIKQHCHAKRSAVRRYAVVLDGSHVHQRVVIDTDLAEGGFSFVYVVHDVDTMEQFAMKKIPCQSSEQRQLVSHELGYRMLIVHNKCRHKHLMPLVDYAVVHTAAPDTSTYFLVFPLVEVHICIMHAYLTFL